MPVPVDVLREALVALRSSKGAGAAGAWGALLAYDPDIAIKAAA